MHKIISSSIAIIISVTLLIAVAVPSLMLGTIALPTGVAQAQAQFNTPPPGACINVVCVSQLASLTDQWFQRYLSIDISTNPSLNPFSPPTGSYTGDCSQLIQGNTLFLVGQVSSTGASQPVNHGTCTISPNTGVLFPLVNKFWIDCQSLNQQKPTGVCAVPVTHPAMGQPFAGYRSLAATLDASNLAASLDRVSLQSEIQEVQSPPGGFEVNLAAFDPFGLNVGQPVTLHGVADGFWVLLPSLPIGQHSLTFGGCANISFDPAAPVIQCQTNTYTLVVQ